MSEILTKLVVNCETGEQQVIPLTPEEITQREADAAAFAVAEAERIAAAEAAAEAKASGIAKLLALGLTEEEANALVK
jgi:TctA family transporter